MDLSRLNSSLLHDAVERLQGHATSERLVCRGLAATARQPAVVAPAHTIRLSRARALDGNERKRVMSAYDAAPAGRAVVIEVVGNVGGGVIGDVVAHRLKVLGVRAVVVDGCVRDVAGNEQFGMPVWAREISMAGMVPSEVHVEVGVTLNVGGVVVRPDDIVAADMDGVFVCPAEFAGAAVELANEFLASEEKTHKGIAAGKSIVEAYPSKAE
ncbi:MAG: RraA family protein [Lautropia sp.]